MTQIKLFMDKTPDLGSFEKKVNDFLKENDGKIQVRDIKYTAEPVNAQNSKHKNWTAMVIFDTCK